MSRDLEFIREESEFYLDYNGVVDVCTSSAGKQAVDEIMWKICSHHTLIELMLLEEKRMLFSMPQSVSLYLT